MYDAALSYAERAERCSRILDTLGLAAKRYILATLHRAENTDDPERMRNILAGFAESAPLIVWPLHPRTRRRLADFGLTLPDSVRAIDPVGYLDMVMLEQHAALIATDSGGVQKEAYFHRVPCITLREETAWVAWVEAGANRLVGTAPAPIGEGLAQAGATGPDPTAGLYGMGDAGGGISEILGVRAA